MPLRGKPIDSITMADVQSLITNEVIERKQSEYKQSLPGRSDADGKELLKQEFQDWRAKYLETPVKTEH